MDKHFLTQNSFSGAVFFVFALGIWLTFSPTEASSLLWQFLKLPNGSVIISGVFAAVSSPMIGLLIQGIVLFSFYVIGRHPYEDQSRKLVADRIRQNIEESADIDPETKKKIQALPNDSLFVVYYYQLAPEQLIEWARRRRDSQHMGENWAVAAITGIVFSFVVQFIAHLESGPRSLIISVMSIFFVVVWVAGMFFLRRKMKNDVDGLELVWALDRMYVRAQGSAKLIERVA